MQTQSPELIGRIRINEARLANLRERLIVTDNNFIEEFRKLSSELKEVKLELKEIRTEIFKIKETLKEIIKEMGSFAGIQEVKVLEKYINMWSPLNFVTEKEVINLIKENAKSTNPNK